MSNQATTDIGSLLHVELSTIKIPPRPAVLTGIESEMCSKAPNYAALEHVISHDVSISASLLKVANSAFFGHRGQVRSIKEALQVLGLRTIGTTLAALSLRKVFEKVPNLERFWDSSAQIAQLSGWLATEIDIPDHRVRPEEAYTFGLFRDCGIPVLMSFYSTYFDVLKLANAEAERPFTDIEQEDIGVDHTLIGSMLAKEWLLPIEFRAGIEIHHTPDAIRGASAHITPDLSRYFVAIAQLAEYLYQRLTGMNKTCEWPKLGDACLSVLRLSATDIEGLLKVSKKHTVQTELLFVQ